MALSYDDRMGRDSVIECVNENGIVNAYTSWTVTGNNQWSSPRDELVNFTNFK